MSWTRRQILATAALGRPLVAVAAGVQGARMYGLIGKMTAVEGKRDELVGLLLENAATMAGCLSYVVATDPADANAIWITEAWDSQASHDASLTLESVRATITKARPLIAGFAPGTVTTPVGGHGLVVSR
jgi:quinol monooxygenase YgiN